MDNEINTKELRKYIRDVMLGDYLTLKTKLQYYYNHDSSLDDFFDSIEYEMFGY